MINKFIETARWLYRAGKRPGNQDHISVQLGCHLEEVSELLREITLVGYTGASSTAMQEVSVILSGVADNLKLGNIKAVMHDRVAVLDALCDADVTGNGVAALMGMHKDIGDIRVVNSNWDKFQDGVPVLKEGGKVGKRDGWVPPSLDELVDAKALAKLSEHLSGRAWSSGEWPQVDASRQVEVITHDCRYLVGESQSLLVDDGEVCFWRLS